MASHATDSFPAITLHNEQQLRDSGSYLDADDRARLLKDLEIQIGDTEAEADIGRIDVSRKEDVYSISKGGLY